MKIGSITVHLVNGAYRVRIEWEGYVATGSAPTFEDAYANACAKMLVKPALVVPRPS